MPKGNKSMNRISSYYGLRIIYEDLDGECLDENGNSLVICGMPDDSGCWCENSDGEEIFRKTSQGVYLNHNRYQYFLNIKKGKQS